tara:strand:- start:117 stop:266 length:150 start_codon:yes stop_codon:yes gene_type:complete
MDKEELENWRKVKERLEKEDLTTSMYYKRAVVILAGNPDPMKLPSLEEE